MLVKKKIVSLIVIIFLSIVLILSMALFLISLNKSYRIQAEITSKCQEINSFTERIKLPLTKDSVRFLEDKQNDLKNIYSRFKLAFASPLSEEISEEELDPLQFKERLIQLQKKLREDANMHNLTLPSSLGFAKYETELSEASEIPDLIRRLKLLEELVYKMIDSKVYSLDGIDFPAVEKKERRPAPPTQPRRTANRRTGFVRPAVTHAAVKAEEEEDIYFEIPVLLKIECTNSRLVSLLYQLRVSPFVFVVDDLDVVQAQAEEGELMAEKRLEANLVIRAIAVN